MCSKTAMVVVVMLAVVLEVVEVVEVEEEDMVLGYDTADQHHFQRGRPGQAVMGVYGWTSPEGVHFLVRYIADAAGYRVLETNAAPVDAAGVAADGGQGAATPTPTS
ncbi:uncharacterized protein LOC126988092 [Eriocheir sinensis]|uniref:uncharacterized protein LOC126988092 n=1 Tax=Eriocheir sinensis TaxID=95602 RepID=UPI0021C8E39F|nr:uncharacterized protein LOC126988092 [Eriocheir sinensis]